MDLSQEVKIVMPKAQHKGRYTKIELRVTPELKETAKEVAQSKGLSVSHWVEQLIERAVKREHAKTGRTD